MKAEATSYQRLREHLSYLGLSTAAENCVAALSRAAPHSTTSRPASVGTDPPGPRSRSRTPRWRSSVRIRSLAEGWAMP